jgi:UDP:flavonoid glycosyltransferase YjiC (YdhE family)
MWGAKTQMARRIILATIGTMGDLHPLIAIAQALRERGIEPVLAVPEDHLVKANAAGIEAVAILPGFAAVCSRMGLGEREAARLIIGDQRKMFEQIVLPDLSACAARLDELAVGADAIVAPTFLIAAPIVAERRALPLISIMLQPMAMLSALDPPNTPDFWMMKRVPVGAVGLMWNRAMYGVLRRVIDYRYGRRIDAVRREHGLAATGLAKMAESSRTALLTLGCYSSHFAAVPEDASTNAQLTGFPLFDSASGAAEPLDPALAAFLADGPPPLVFTLGTFAVNAAGRFYDEAVAVAHRLGARAVLLTGNAASPVAVGTIFACAYAPHSRVFPHASAIIHHGGIGTTGQALRAGKPQLIVPHMGDQNDHAARIERLGIGRHIAPRHFRADNVAPLLETMLRDRTMCAAAGRIGTAIAAEQGAIAAATAIETALA